MELLSKIIHVQLDFNKLLECISSKSLYYNYFIVINYVELVEYIFVVCDILQLRIWH